MRDNAQRRRSSDSKSVKKNKLRKVIRWGALALCILILIYSHVILFQTRTGLEYNHTAEELPEMSNGECVKILQEDTVTKWDCYPVWNVSGFSFKPPFSGIVVTYNYPDREVLPDLNLSNHS